MMNPHLQKLVDQIQVEPIEDVIFRGSSKDNFCSGRIFGGQVLGQALMSAYLTVDPKRLPHSLHAYFLRPGDTRAPVVYSVDKIRDGGSFTSRRVVAVQHGEPIFHLSASFHEREEDAFYHQEVTMPVVPSYDELPNEEQLVDMVVKHHPNIKRELIPYEKGFEIRPINHMQILKPGNYPAVGGFWFKANSPLPDNQALQISLLTYLSDYYLLLTSLLPHNRNMTSPDVQFASIDHAAWFHRNLDLNDWLLYSIESPTASFGCGYSLGKIYNRDGVLVASTAQEGLIRKTKPKQK